MNLKQLDHVNLSVANFAESADWYRRVFGFQIVEQGVSENRPWGVLRSGEAMLCIYERPDLCFLDYREHFQKGHHAIAHFGFRITDRKIWEETIDREKVRCVHASWRYPHSISWYVVDPTGWEIEVALWDDDTVRFG